jgi:AraC-like DNA-binding protein
MLERRASTRLPARYVAVALDYLASIGVDRDAVLRPARIRAIDDPSAQVTLGQLEALLGAASRVTGRSDLGFELGQRLDPTTHDILGFALLTSPTFGDLLRLATTYQRLIQPVFALSLHRRTDHIDLVYTPAVAVPPLSMHTLEEAIVVSNHVAYRSALGDKLPTYDAWLSIGRPRHASRYRELAPARVHFGDASPGLRISLPASLLDTPLAMANPRAMRAAEERCRAMLRRMHVRRRWTEWCRMMLRESEDSRPTLEQLARIVNLSPRTLARYLEAERASFRELSLQVRTERARGLLQEGELSVTQVAYRLGYGDVASFVRSFRRRTGRTPGAVSAHTRGR